ncbi:MAG TPA: TonB family protein [Myxococcota bacterium]|jgi:TonB family protein
MAASVRALIAGLVAGGVAALAQAAELVVEWAPLAARVEAYQIDRRVDDPGEEWKPLARVGGDATRFTDRSASAGVRYCYRVRGLRGYQMSPPSPPLCNVASEAVAAVAEAAEPAPEPPPTPPPPRGEDREVKAIRRPPPAYPPGAQLQGISGWVKLRFTVTAQGATRDIQVVGAEPPGVFDQAALDAAQRFVYAPRLENGVAVDRPNVETEITFTWIDRGGILTTDGRPRAPR